MTECFFGHNQGYPRSHRTNFVYNYFVDYKFGILGESGKAIRSLLQWHFHGASLESGRSAII